MANEIIQAAKIAYPLAPIVDGKGPVVPKEDVLTLFTTVQSELDSAKQAAEGAVAAEELRAKAAETELSASIVGSAEGIRSVKTWAILNPITGLINGQKGEVVSDSGSHTDPVSGLTVKNEGIYSWVSADAKWTRTGDRLTSKSFLWNKSGFPGVVIDGGKALCPPISWATKYASASDANPSNALFAAELNFPGGATAETLVYDRSDGTWTVLPFPNIVQPDIYTDVVRYNGGIYADLGAMPVIGDVPGGTVQNMMGIDKNRPDDASSVYIATNQYVADVTDTDLIALGFTKGFKTDSATKFVNYGCRLPDYQPGKWAFARVYIQANADNDFGTPKFWFVRADETGGLSTNLTLEKKISARAAIYSGWFKMSAADIYPNAWVGTQAWGVAPIICGAQIHYGAPTKLWISRTDYANRNESPAPGALGASRALGNNGFDVLYTPNMFLVEGRKQVLYPDNLAPFRRGRLSRRTTLKVTPALGGVPYVRSAPADGLLIDPADFADGDILEIVAASDHHRVAYRASMPVTVQKAAASALTGKTLNLLFIGDSLIDAYGLPAAAKAKCEALGATVTMIGTVTNTDIQARYSSVLAEGRAGASFTDYTHEKVGELAPIPVGDEADYISGVLGSKRIWNPFIRVSDVGDNADFIKNGYIFDLDFYLNRWTPVLADPTHVIVNLGTNDLKDETAATGLANIASGVEIIGGQIRAALPSATIIFIGNPAPRTAGGNVDWETNRYNGWKKMIEAVGDLADANAFAVAGWAHASVDVGWLTSTAATDPVTGQVTKNINDNLHYTDVAMEQVAEVVASAIANTAL